MDEFFELINMKTEGPGMMKQLSKFANTPLDQLPLTMAYVPMQPLDQVYEQDVALQNGTLFPSLDKPFIGKKM